MLRLSQQLKVDGYSLPLKRPAVEIVRSVPTRVWKLDPDNVLVKPILDAMVHHGILVDDTEDHINLHRTQDFGRSKYSFTEIQISIETP